MYADDTLVYSSIDTTDDCIQLQRDLLELENGPKYIVVFCGMLPHYFG